MSASGSQEISQHQWRWYLSATLGGLDLVLIWTDLDHGQRPPVHLFIALTVMIVTGVVLLRRDGQTTRNAIINTLAWYLLLATMFTVGEAAFWLAGVLRGAIT